MKMRKIVKHVCWALFALALALILLSAYFIRNCASNPGKISRWDCFWMDKYLAINGLPNADVCCSGQGYHIYSSLFKKDGKCADISFIKNVPVVYLDLNFTSVKDLSPIRNNKTIKILDLNFTPVVDIKPLSTVPNLEKLFLDGTEVSDITAISSLPKLVSLYLDNTKVSDLGPLAKLWEHQRGLVSLGIDGTLVTDIAPLSSVQRFKYLSMSNTNVSDLSPLKEVKGICTLIMRGVLADDFSPVPVDCLNILHLDIDKDWKGLEKLRKKRRLMINGKHPDDFWAEYDRRKAEREKKSKGG